MISKTHTPLQKLIFGMSPEERVLLKKNGLFSTGRPNTLARRLFDLLSTDKIYSTDEQCRHLGIRSKTQLSGIKARLFDDILHIKTKNKSEISARSMLPAYRQQIVTLMESGLYETAEALCKKALHTAKDYGQYSFLADFLHLQNNAIRFRNYRNFKKTNAIIFRDIKEALFHQRVLEQLKLFYEQIKVLGYRTWLPISEAEFKDILLVYRQFEDFKDSQDFIQSTGNEPLIQIYFLLTDSFFHYLLHKRISLSEHCDNLLKCWTGYKYLINEFAFLFLDSVKITAYIDFLNNDVPQAKSHLNQYSFLAEKYLYQTSYKKMFSTHHFNTLLKIYHKTASYGQVKTMIENQAQEAIEMAEDALPPPETLTIYTTIGISYFVLQRWDDAEEMILTAKEKNFAIGREDLLYFHLIFYLLILYEKREWYRLDSSIESAYHLLYSRKKLRLFEKLMFSFFKQLITARDKESEKKACNDFLTRLEGVNRKDLPLYTLYFNFPGWAESKVRGISYTDYVKEKVGDNKRQIPNSN